MKIAMAAPYDIKNKRSWSGTPWSLYNGLCSYSDNQITTFNLSEYHSDKLIKKNIIQHMDLKRSIRERHPVSKLGPAFMNPLNSSILSDVCSKNDFDVLIEFGGFQPAENLPPYYVYTDASHDMALSFYRETGKLPFYHTCTVDELERAAEFVRPVYQNAAGIFCMSEYLSKVMINVTGVPAERVHTVYAGANWHDAFLPDTEGKSIENKDCFDILLTGVDFYGKGMDVAIEAVKLLNERSGNHYRLHLCGVKDGIPEADYIVNHGFVDKSALVELLQKCDLFVLPSRFDCFGIAFVEAMTFGLPCIGRNICAMPEIIDEGINGELVTGDASEELAGLIEKICGDADLYRRYSKSAIAKAEKFTWEKVCGDMVNIIRKDLNI